VGKIEYSWFAHHIGLSIIVAIIRKGIVSTPMHYRKNLPLLCALISSAAILALGVDIWFRNEAGNHLLWFQNHPGFWDAVKYPGIINHYRPVAFLMLSVIYRLFGPAALPFVLANFIGFLFTLFSFYLLIRYRLGDTVAYFSLIALFPLFYHVLYYPFNALHGIFYSWDVGWFCLAFYFFQRSLERGERRVTQLILTVLFALIAMGTHGFSGLTLAIVIGAYVIFRYKNFAQNRWLLVVAIAIPIFSLALIPILEPMGGQVLKTGAPLFPRMYLRYGLIARIIMFPRLGPVIIGGITQTIAYYYFRRRGSLPLWGLSAAVIVFVLQHAFPLATVQVALLTLMAAFLLLIVAKIGDLRVFALMGLLGFLHYFIIRGESSNYLRYLVFGITPIIIFGILKIGAGILATLRRPLPTARSLPVWSAALTALTLVVIGLGLMDISGFSGPVRKIRYLCHLSQNFHDVVFQGTKLLPEDSHILLYLGDVPANNRAAANRVQARDIATMYTRAHLYNLRPAKVNEYRAYFYLAGRRDFRSNIIEHNPELSPGETVYIMAFNIYEVLRTRTKFPTSELLYYVRRGQAEAAIFQLTVPAAYSSLDTLPTP
jgi:hypothetical protein